MDKEIFGVRIKAWLVALAIFVLVVGFCVGIVVIPKIIGIIFKIIFGIGSISTLLYIIAFSIDLAMG